LIPLAALSAAAGAGKGVICGLFRLALEKADRFRNLIPQWCQHEPLLGCSLMIAGAALAASLKRLSRAAIQYAFGREWHSSSRVGNPWRHTSSTFYFAAG
jgi:hypothetical protein